MQFKLLSLLTFVTLATAQAGDWQQCGGFNYSGPNSCRSSSYYCKQIHEYFWQCVPGPDPNLPTPTPTTTFSTIVGLPTSTPITPPAGEGPGTTLQSGYYWVRAVAPPNFHKYLQSSPPRSVGDALIDNPATAGQFNIVNGQLVQLINKSGDLLYGHVTPRSGSETKLLLTFATEPSNYGTFSWSGDTLQWSISSIQRPNNAAFLVCEGQKLYINLGPYAYQTPAGCVDQTIHYFNGAQVD